MSAPAAALRPWGRLRWAMTDALVLTKRSLLHIPRIPELLVFATIQPVMFVLLFRYVFGGAINVQGASYVNFLMAGVFVQTVTFGAMTTGIGLSTDLSTGLVDRFRSLPMARSAVLLGRTLADLARNSLVVLIMVLVGLGVGFRPEAGVLEWLATAGMLLLLSFSFSWIGATIALFVRNPEAVQSAGFIWLFPLTFASSAFVQTASMPGWLQAFADHQPITLIINTVRGLLLDQPIGSDGPVAALSCAAILLVFAPLAVARFRNAGS